MAKLVTNLANDPQDSKTVSFRDYLCSGWKSLTLYFYVERRETSFFPLLNLGYVAEGLYIRLIKDRATREKQ